jgi:hypothetical protein
MKVREIATVGTIALCISCNCNQIKEKLLPTFTVDIPEIKLAVPPLPKVVNKEIPVGALKTHINMDSAIRANTNGVFGASAVHFVKVKKVLIKATNADAKNNLSNFESARMTIYSDTASTEIANIKFPLTFTNSVTVTPEQSPDISNYLRGTTLAYNVYWKNRKVTKKFLKLTVTVTVGVQ